MYSITDLKEHYHGSNYGQVNFPGHSILHVPMDTSYVTPDFSVLRGNHPVFKKYFADLSVPIHQIIPFVIERGGIQAKRDNNGARMDGGCAGQDRHGGTGAPPGKHKPSEVVMIESSWFLGDEDEDKYSHLRYIFGEIMLFLCAMETQRKHFRVCGLTRSINRWIMRYVY